jgi:hypothetical protein
MRISVKTIILLFLVNIPSVVYPVIPTENLVVPILFLWSWLVKPRVVHQPATASIVVRPGDPYRFAKEEDRFKLLSWSEFLRGKMKEEKDSIIKNVVEANGSFADYWTAIDTSEREARGQRESALEALEALRAGGKIDKEFSDGKICEAVERLDKMSQEKTRLEGALAESQAFSMQEHSTNEVLASQLRKAEEERLGVQERATKLAAETEQLRSALRNLQEQHKQPEALGGSSTKPVSLISRKLNEHAANGNGAKH